MHGGGAPLRCPGPSGPAPSHFSRFPRGPSPGQWEGAAGSERGGLPARAQPPQLSEGGAAALFLAAWHFVPFHLCLSLTLASPVLAQPIFGSMEQLSLHLHLPFTWLKEQWRPARGPSRHLEAAQAVVGKLQA